MATGKQAVIEHPLARSEQVLVEQIGLEAVAFDLETRTSHALKPLAAAVFMYSDGSNTATEIAELASYRLDAVVTEAEVTDALEQLGASGLLDTRAIESANGGFSRRDALKVFAASGVGAALITSVSAQSALAQTEAAQTTLGNNLWCVTGSVSGQSGGTASVSITNGQSAGSSGVNGVLILADKAVCPQPGVKTIRVTGGSSYTLGNSCNGGDSCWSSNAPNVTEGAACNYLAYSSASGYAVTGGSWQCVPCDGNDGYQCCSVVCAPGGTGYTWGSTALGPPAESPDYFYDHPTPPYATPPGDQNYPNAYTGCGANSSGCGGTGSGGATTNCPHPGEPDYAGSGNSYQGKYCTVCGGKPS